MKSYLFISPSDLFGSLPLKGSATSFLKPGDLRLGIDDDTHIWELELPLTALPEDESWAELVLALEQSLRKMLDNLPEEGRPKILLIPLYEKGKEVKCFVNSSGVKFKSIKSLSQEYKSFIKIAPKF